jgi:hypothetical protein
VSGPHRSLACLFNLTCDINRSVLNSGAFKGRLCLLFFLVCMNYFCFVCVHAIMTVVVVVVVVVVFALIKQIF